MSATSSIEAEYNEIDQGKNWEITFDVSTIMHKFQIITIISHNFFLIASTLLIIDKIFIF